VVSHDRYLVERVTDQQYAVLDGHLRHLPRGVDQYLELRAAQTAPAKPPASAAPKGLGGAELRNAQKELAAAERKLVKLNENIAALHQELAAHDQTDYTGLGALSTKLTATEAELAALEERWLELSSLLG
jgi:ABC transport system ATP-binding/permease protein